VRIAPLTVDHWSEVERIYAAGIATGHATFESEPPTWEHFAETRLADHRQVALDEHQRVVGWVAASAVSERCVYAGVVEHSVYVDPRVQGQGVGRLLLQALIASTEAAGVWTIQSGVFPENTASLALHRAVGFRDVGIRQRVGRMGHGPFAGRWRDVVLIERRSSTVGD
jgi:L-amino acid N-acyltransferase YncA